jgi:hypothetical protein
LTEASILAAEFYEFQRSQQESVCLNLQN